jgi:hypothetical protein
MSHEERLWKFRKPEWMNSATARSAGVYGSGALVGEIVSFFDLVKEGGIDVVQRHGQVADAGRQPDAISTFYIPPYAAAIVSSLLHLNTL